MRHLLLLVFCCAACSQGESTAPGPTATVPATEPTGAVADVVAVVVDGEPGAYTFAVTLRSPDAGCDRYADWWEISTPEGELVLRRILAHSHVDEQPFTRSGGPVDLAADREVVVRAHMSVGGYGGAAMRGTPGGGFTVDPSIDARFAAALATEPPLPDGCAF